MELQDKIDPLINNPLDQFKDNPILGQLSLSQLYSEIKTLKDNKFFQYLAALAQQKADSTVCRIVQVKHTNFMELIEREQEIGAARTYLDFTQTLLDTEQQIITYNKLQQNEH